MRYGSIVGALGLASIALAGCGEYGWLWSEAGQPGSGNHDPKPGSDGGAPACVDVAFDHDVACEDAPTAKDQASADCQSRKLELTALGPKSCLAGDLVRLKYTCCPRADAFPPSSGGMVPPDPARYAQYRCCTSSTSCVVQLLGGASVCEDSAAFKAESSAACAKIGGTLTDVGLDVACSP